VPKSIAPMRAPSSGIQLGVTRLNLGRGVRRAIAIGGLSW